MMTFPQRAGARFISHKHEPMDPITLRRYVCLLNSVKSKETREGEGDTCYAGLSCYVDPDAEIYPVYVIMNKGFGVLIVFKHHTLCNKCADWQESEKPGGLVGGNVFLWLFARK